VFFKAQRRLCLVNVKFIKKVTPAEAAQFTADFPWTQYHLSGTFSNTLTALPSTSLWCCVCKQGCLAEFVSRGSNTLTVKVLDLSILIKLILKPVKP